MENSHPLVSVLVCAYNSADTILETLESIRLQSYAHLELIVSDDCSTDDTVEKCRDWMKMYKGRFVITHICENTINAGIGANLNKGIPFCNGVWIKTIAGDDLLDQECISNNIDYVNRNQDASVVFSKCQFFNNEGKLNHFFNGSFLADFDLPNEEQLVQMYKRSFVPTPSQFIKSSVLNKYHYPEKYVILEDYPMWILLLENGYRFYYFDKVTTYYRFHSSASRVKGTFVKEGFINVVKYHFYDNIYPKICNRHPEIVRKHQRQFMLWDIQIFILGNRINLVTRIINKILSFFY